MTLRIPLHDPPNGNGHATRLPFKYQPRSDLTMLARLGKYTALAEYQTPQPVVEAQPESNGGECLPNLDQESLATLLLYDAEYGNKVRSRVPITAWDGLYRRIATKAYAYLDTYRKPPLEHSLDMFSDLEREDPKQKDQVRRLWESINESREGINAQYVLGRIDDFLCRQSFRKGIIESVELLESGKLAEAQALMRNALEGKGVGTSIDFAPMTLGELMTADVAVEYLIESLLVAKQPILLAGPVKSLKTSLLLDLCLSLATGKEFLGRFIVLRTIKVAVLSGESGLPVIKETLLRIARARRIDPAKVSNLIISDRIPQLSNAAHLDAIRRLILDHKPELLAVDPAYLALDGTDAANVMIFGQQLRAVSELCQELGVALLLCHHTKKGSATDYQSLELTDAAWAGFAEHCRQWLLINHREKYDPDTGIHRLWFKAGGSAGHSGLWAVDVDQGRFGDPKGRRWAVTVNTATDAKDEAADRRVEQQQADGERKVLKAMAALEVKNPDGSSQTAIRGEAKFTNGVERFKAILNNLVLQGEVAECKIVVGNKATPIVGYRLVDGGDE